MLNTCATQTNSLVHKDVKHMCNTDKFLEYIRMLNTCVTQTYLYRVHKDVKHMYNTNNSL